MSKPRVSPGFRLFQIVVQDYKHRKPVPANVVKNSRIWKDSHNLDEIIPERTLFKWAKDNRRAKRWAKKFGTIIACFKVDSHERYLYRTEHLRLNPKPIEINISAEEFTIGRDLEVKLDIKTKKIDINGA